MSSEKSSGIEPEDEEVFGSISYKIIDYLDDQNNSKEGLQRLSVLTKLHSPELRAKYWRKLLETGKDTPGCFLEMLQMNRVEKFPYHLDQSDENKNELKWQWVFKKLQVSANHRVEKIPTRVEISELVKDLNDLPQSTTIIFNITQNVHFLDKNIIHLNNLEWLNLADCNLSVGKLRNIIHAINRGNLKHLKALILTGNPSINIETLHLELSKLTKGELQYIELTPISLSESVRETSILKPIELNLDKKLLNDAKKFKYLLDEKIIVSRNQRLNNIWIDYCVCNGNWVDRVKIGLASSVKSSSFKVVLQKEEAARAERVLGEKISRTMVRRDGGDVQPMLKKRRRTGGIYSFKN